MSRLSVVVPTLDEEATLARSLGSIRRELPEAELLVVDGGSKDQTLRVAGELGARVVQSERGRGNQCRRGQEDARGSWLLFLHADCELLEGAGRALGRAMDEGVVAATLRLTYARPGLVYRMVEWSSRVDSYFTSYGDQGLLVRRDLLTQVGGFASLPLFEDVDLLRRLRRRTRIRKLPAHVKASTRRYERTGLVRQLLINAGLMACYALGGSPHRLAHVYRAARTSS